ncbi:hypothetical protein RF11_09617 [Thelohanellus kitauei]|uniref:Tc1-like transposase DDE domain-containing protein n=1 Tax=Thelohanellus kitauei TaxID=669202 RepID=A0A0C2MF26_THEKT|nr:hypothetical protein RF11_09284 [Thelohanellus kitauei]KII65726.1 hypothetical protein RF11_09617 [Thelohanellus kitauei]
MLTITKFYCTPFSTTDVIYVDESGLNFNIRRSYCRSRQRQCANITMANSRERSISVCAAMNLAGYRYGAEGSNGWSLCEHRRVFGSPPAGLSLYPNILCQRLDSENLLE